MFLPLSNRILYVKYTIILLLLFRSFRSIGISLLRLTAILVVVSTSIVMIVAVTIVRLLLTLLRCMVTLPSTATTMELAATSGLRPQRFRGVEKASPTTPRPDGAIVHGIQHRRRYGIPTLLHFPVKFGRSVPLPSHALSRKIVPGVPRIRSVFLLGRGGELHGTFETKGILVMTWRFIIIAME